MHCKRTGNLPEAGEVGKRKAGFNAGESASRVLSIPINSSLCAMSALFHGPPKYMHMCQVASGDFFATSFASLRPYVRAWHLTRGCVG